MWDRMNTIFKFHLETWFFFAVAGAVAVRLLLSAGGPAWKAAAALTGAATLFTAVTAVPGYTRSGHEDWPKGTLDGTAYLASKAPGDRGAYEWIDANVRGVPVILEAQGDAYQDFSRYSMMTGLPTVLGWEYHTFQRGHSQPEIDRRKADVRTAYTAKSADEVAAVLRRYHVALVVVGPLEKKTYGSGIPARFAQFEDLLTPVYRNPEVTLFAVQGAFAPGAATPPLKVEELPAPGVGAAAAPPAQQPAGQVRQPRGLASDAQGRIYVADFGNVRIQALQNDLAPRFAFGALGSGPGEFRDPCAVAVDAQGLLYVADTWNGRIQVFDGAGAYQREFAADFFGPRGVAVDGNGAIFVADTGNNRVVRFDAEGRKETEWGKTPGDGKLAEPQGLALGGGLLYVADNGNGRVAVFTKGGEFVRAFPVPGWKRAVMGEPYLAVDASGVVWVSVPLAGEVRGYSPEGKLLATARGADQPEGRRFEHPSGVALLPGGRLAVADLEGRVVVIDLPAEDVSRQCGARLKENVTAGGTKPGGGGGPPRSSSVPARVPSSRSRARDTYAPPPRFSRSHSRPPSTILTAARPTRKSPPSRAAPCATHVPARRPSANVNVRVSRSGVPGSTSSVPVHVPTNGAAADAETGTAGAGAARRVRAAARASTSARAAAGTGTG